MTIFISQAKKHIHVLYIFKIILISKFGKLFIYFFIKLYEVLREAQDYVSQKAENSNNFHVAECFSIHYQNEYKPGQMILRKQHMVNVYVLLREGPAPPPRKLLTTEDAIDHYVQVHRSKEITHSW